jgi:hypothetical protein
LPTPLPCPLQAQKMGITNLNIITADMVGAAANLA